MNREIKFRGQRADNGLWVYGYYVKDPQGNHRMYLQPFAEASSNSYILNGNRNLLKTSTWIYKGEEGSSLVRETRSKIYCPVFK